jgi:hypothetical protein
MSQIYDFEFNYWKKFRFQEQDKFKGVVVAIKEVFNGQLSQKYKSLDQILSLSDIFKQKSCILK